LSSNQPLLSKRFANEDRAGECLAEPPRVVRIEDIDAGSWDAYVTRKSQASIYHQISWRDVLTEAFGKECHYLAAVSRSGAVRGVLPLVRLNAPLLPNMLISLPYCNYGGLVADSEDDARALLDEAITIGDSLKSDLIEIRNATPINNEKWRPRQDKVGMILELPSSQEGLGKMLGAKRRSQIKRSLREQPKIRRGGIDCLDDFYSVFARKMHELGTPVYPKRFFKKLCEKLSDSIVVLVVELEDRPVAACLLIRWRSTMEIPWAAADSAYNRLAVNMLLYWEALSFAIETGCSHFDFGRSTRGAGTYNFKRQWGAEPVDLAWYTRSSDGQSVEENNASATMQLASRVWQRLPLSVANLLGPIIAPNLPW